MDSNKSKFLKDSVRREKQNVCVSFCQVMKTYFQVAAGTVTKVPPPRTSVCGCEDTVAPSPN